LSSVPDILQDAEHEEGVSPRAAKRLRDAMDRLLAGRPQRTDGRLIKDNLWKEAGLSRATMNRAVRIMAEWRSRVAECDGFTPGRPVKTMKLRLCERNSKTKLVSARSSTIGSTRPLPQSPRCITTTSCYVKNSTGAANSSPCTLTAEGCFKSSVPKPHVSAPTFVGGIDRGSRRTTAARQCCFRGGHGDLIAWGRPRSRAQS
jgi:hypothetical protein